MSNDDGFGTRESSGTWCRIANGKVTRSATADTPNATKVPKVDKKGKHLKDEAGNELWKYEIQNESVSGLIRKFKMKTDTFEGTEVPKLVVTLKRPSGALINVDMKQGDRYWMGLMNVLPNIDLNKEVTLQPYDYIGRKDNKRKIGMGATQGGQDIKWRYTKDSTDGPPPLDYARDAKGEPLVVDGRKIPIWGPIIDFYIEKVLTPANEKLVAIIAQEDPSAVTEEMMEGAGTGTTSAGQTADANWPAVDDTDDDTPF